MLRLGPCSDGRFEELVDIGGGSDSMHAIACGLHVRRHWRFESVVVSRSELGVRRVQMAMLLLLIGGLALVARRSTRSILHLIRVFKFNCFVQI